MLKQIKNQKGIAAIFEVGLAILVIGVLGFVGYRSYQARQAKPVETTQEETKTEEAADLYKSWKTYTDSSAMFNVRYPGDWNIAAAEFDPEAEDYKDFEVASADYKRSTEGIPFVSAGAAMRVSVSNTRYATADEVYANEGLISKIGKNKTSTRVDGIQALKYEIHYETNPQIFTSVVKAGREYTIILSFADEAAKLKYQKTYDLFVDSFRFK